jgi:hypothetical protein
VYIHRKRRCTNARTSLPSVSLGILDHRSNLFLLLELLDVSVNDDTHANLNEPSNDKCSNHQALDERNALFTCDGDLVGVGSVGEQACINVFVRVLEDTVDGVDACSHTECKLEDGEAEVDLDEDLLPPDTTDQAEKYQ